jgi:uncharacterized protein (TIGR03437 family)
VVSSASYVAPIAPDSLASIFGSNLSRATASAALDSNGQLPLELASTRVDVNGTPASLIYVSPGQINFVVPAGVGVGVTTVTVRSTDTTATLSTTVQITATAPAIFSSNASGSGPGAILNAVTFASAPFLVETPENGADVRTRLAVYGTGLRAAKNLAARAIDSNGNSFDLTVEFAGAAPGFFGLDQLNFIVPAGLDGAGNVSLFIRTDDGTSNTVTFLMGLLPASSLRLFAITLDPAFVTAGQSMVATVFLNGIARPGGFSVGLRTTNAAAQIQQILNIPEGQSLAQAPVTTTPIVTSTQAGTVTASAFAVTVSAPFEVTPTNQAQLAGISISPASTLGGQTVFGTITLTAPAPAGGVSVVVVSDTGSVRVPNPVIVPFSQTSVTFPIVTTLAPAPLTANITASLGRLSFSATLGVAPPLFLTVDNNTVTGGTTVTGTVVLGEPAPLTGSTISLQSNDGSVARVPLFVTVGSGLASAQFPITTLAVTTARTVTISATFQGITQTVTLSVIPQAAPVLSSLTVSPSAVIGGASTQGIVTLTAPSGFGSQQITLQSSSPVTASVPPFVFVPQGATSVQFTINTIRVITTQSVTITATQGAVTRVAILTVQPPTFP